MADQDPRSFWDHLNELRQRLIICMVAIAVGIVVSFVFADQVFRILLVPARDINLVFIDVTEMLGTYMQVSLICGIILAMPVLVFHLIMFVSPGLTPGEKKYVWIVLPWIFLMFVAGVAFSYYVLLPPAMQFLLSFGADIATPQIRISNYVSLIGRLLLASGLIFETPVITTFLARLGVISSNWMARQRKWAIIFAFILGAVITPTIDPVNQTLVALPLIVLYEISIWLAKLVERKRRIKQAPSIS
jgi:sec-independent protein translocase protein TatC